MSLAWYQYPITHGYITDYQGPGTDTPHYAFDIGTPLDTPVWFPKSGTIEQADYAVWSGKQGGGEVFLKPDDGMPVEYMYHLDQIQVHAGQHVNANQQVGLSGGQNSGGSHPTDPMWSSGPHLHIGEFDSWVNTPDGVRPYGANPQYIINLASANTDNKPIDATAVDNNPFDAIGNIATSVSNFQSLFSASNLTRVGMFALGGIVVIGGVVMLAHTGEK